MSLVQGLAECENGDTKTKQRQRYPGLGPLGAAKWSHSVERKTGTEDLRDRQQSQARSAPQLKEGLVIVNRQRSSSVKKETR